MANDKVEKMLEMAEKKKIDTDKVSEKAREVMNKPKFVPPPIEEPPSPSDFFVQVMRPFVEHGVIQKSFVDFYAYRIASRNELPTPQALAADLQELKSGVKAPRMIQFIVEEYATKLNEYLAKAGGNATQISQFGITPPQPQYPTPYAGIPVSSNPNPTTQYPFIPVNTKPPVSLVSYQNPNNEQYMTIKDFMLWQKEQELRQLKEQLESKNQNEFVNQIMEEIKELRKEREQEMKEKIKELERKLEEKGDKLTREDIREELKNLLKLKEERITKEDIERIVENVLKKTTPHRPMSITPEEIERLKIENEFKLKMKEYEDKKETRDTIAKAIKEGFSLFGKAVYRTMLEEGTEERLPTEGVESETGLMELICPSCNNTIITPVSSKRVTCPHCGKIWIIERPSHIEEMSEPQSPPPPPKSTPEPASQEPEPPPPPKSEPKIEVKQIEVEKPPEQEVPILQDKEGNYVCPICGSKFKTERGLKTHVGMKHK